MAASYSRPRVSDDKAFSEAWFRTCQYRPDYPHGDFDSFNAAREWTLDFVRGYHQQHRHSALRSVMPAERQARHTPGSARAGLRRGSRPLEPEHPEFGCRSGKSG